MSKLRISDDLSLPASSITQTFGVLAVRGAGKSNLAAVMAEQMHDAGLPFIVIDPVGAWYGLRSSGDGKSPGLSIPIFGGRRGDIPIERTSGAELADVVVDERLSAVIDVSEFSEGDKIRFLIDFAERLYRRNEQPLHLFLEEADDYCPQRPMREQARLLRAWENIVRRGRARGLGMTMITQRSAALNKNVLTQVETLFVLRTTSPQDRKAIGGWVDFHGENKALLETLPSLASGEAWVWSPTFLGITKRIRVDRRRTYDSGATPTTAEGRAPATLADIDVPALRQRFAVQIEKAKADDPKELRREIAELKRQVAAAERTMPAAMPAERVEVPVLSDEQAALLHDLSGRLCDVKGDFADATMVLESVEKDVNALRAVIAAATSARAIATACPVPARPETRRAVARMAEHAAKAANNGHKPTASLPDGPLTGPEQRILDAIAWLEDIGVAEPEQTAVAFLADYTYGAGSFNNPRGRLRARGFVDYLPQNRIRLTDEGRPYTNHPDVPLTVAQMHEHVLGRLPGPEQRVLRPLLDAYPNKMSNEDLAHAAGYTPGAGSFNNPRGRLRSLGLIEYPEPGFAVARGILFLEFEK